MITPGQRPWKTNPRGASGDQHANPGEDRQPTQAAAHFQHSAAQIAPQVGVEVAFPVDRVLENLKLISFILICEHWRSSRENDGDCPRGLRPEAYARCIARQLTHR